MADESGKEMEVQIARQARQMEAQYNYLSQQLEQAKAQFEQVARGIEENREALKAVKEIQTSPKDTLVDLGGGTLVKAKGIDSSNVLVTVGAGVLCSKTPQEAEKILIERIEKLTQLLNSIDQAMAKMLKARQELSAAFQQMQLGQG